MNEAAAQDMARHANPSAVLRLESLRHSYGKGHTRLEVLKGANLALMPGQTVALVGPSGAGKSTLLHIAGLLERPAAGKVIIDGRDCAALNDDQRTRLRRSHIGFVYQSHRLLPEFSALENIILPLRIAGQPKALAARHAGELLRMMGLTARAGHRPSELSGGEQQRVAIARAVANAPRILLADEPTGNLDPKTAERVFSTLIEIVRASGLAALIATHNLALAARMDRVIELADGRIVEKNIS